MACSMRVGLGLNELDVDVHAVAGFLHTAFENIGHTQFPRDFRKILRVALVASGRSARDDSEPADSGKRGDDFILDALREEGVFLVGT